MFDSRATAHTVVDARYDPLVGEQRIEKTDSENTPPSSFRFDTPGWTETFTVEGLLNRMQE
ncbi:hypothetical protein N0B31_15015 [Salinirubellus salinus]|uniref:Uncharacterized protein n=1 Tax=Salinirubellus salinus TaxID=1364945 RepID=A0A9E7U3N5_9EURY|nr:hypothetical protein [Salinirubellus salinus]UWM53445.1 hypothetical protein N0B31_15015 [Salinirubellus salinus]